MTVLQGIAHWASITRPNTMFDPAYKIDLSIDLKDDKVKKILKEYPSLKDTFTFEPLPTVTLRGFFLESTNLGGRFSVPSFLNCNLLKLI